jgi:hypothetical protein
LSLALIALFLEAFSKKIHRIVGQGKGDFREKNVKKSFPFITNWNYAGAKPKQNNLKNIT